MKSISEQEQDNPFGIVVKCGDKVTAASDDFQATLAMATALMAKDDELGERAARQFRGEHLTRTLEWNLPGAPPVKGTYLVPVAVFRMRKTFCALLAAGADPNINLQRATPLLLDLIAAREVEMVRAAVAAGCRLDITDENHNTAIDWCFRTNQFELLPLFDPQIDGGALKKRLAQVEEFTLPESDAAALGQRLFELGQVKSHTIKVHEKWEDGQLTQTGRRKKRPPPWPDFDQPGFLRMTDYLHAFPLVSIENEWRLEFYHPFLHEDGGARDAYPLIFVHPQGTREPRKKFYGEAPSSEENGPIIHLPWPAFDDFGPLPHLSFACMPEGFIQFALFIEEIHQFYLGGHANYDRLYFILTDEDRQRYLDEFIVCGGSLTELPKTEQDKLRRSRNFRALLKTDLRPRLRLCGNLRGEVESMVYRPCADQVGFHRRRVVVRWPNVVEKIEYEPVFTAERGFLF